MYVGSSPTLGTNMPEYANWQSGRTQNALNVSSSLTSGTINTCMRIQALFEEQFSQFVTSSNLDEVGYDDEKETMDITFLSGSTYRYFDVPMDEYEQLIKASSKGRYFWRNIRDNYSYKRLSY